MDSGVEPVVDRSPSSEVEFIPHFTVIRGHDAEADLQVESLLSALGITYLTDEDRGVHWGGLPILHLPDGRRLYGVDEIQDFFTPPEFRIPRLRRDIP
ncbi:hypothetical protein HY346_01465 [Candidatus Microgenomates bacterium]|nr:hypothetical protein [Candidatus Microgenomates bacterium]